MKLEKLIELLQDAKEQGKEEVVIKSTSGISWNINDKMVSKSMLDVEDKQLKLWVQ